MERTQVTDILLALRQHAELTPRSVAIITSAGYLHYRDFVRRTDSVAGYAAELGIRPGSKVLVDTAATDSRLMVTLGLMRLGASVGFGRAVKRYAEAGFAIDAMISESAKPAPGVNVLPLSPSWFEAGMTGPATADRPYELIFDSSGTTGIPKLIRFSKTNIDHRLRLLSDPRFPPLPRYYTTTGTGRALSVAEFFATLVRGGTIIQPSDRSPSGILDTINLFRPNLVSMAPATLLNILRLLREEPRRLERIDCLRLSGAHCSADTREEALEKLAREVVILFGATEIGRVTQGGASELGDAQGAVGRAIDDVEVEIVDGEGGRLPPGSDGEIRVRIPEAGVTSYVAAGGDRSPLRDGWFYPGDTGRMSADGNLIVTGRTSLVINVGGNKISPERAEELLKSIDGVEDVGVLGVKDGSGFDIVCALIVGRPELSLETLNDFLRSKRAIFMVSRLRLVPAIPRVETGKVDRERLRELAA